MHLLIWIIVGILAGTLTRQIVPGTGPVGVPGDGTRGMIGALAGGWLFQLLLGSGFGGWFMSTCVAFTGAVIALILSRVAFERRLAWHRSHTVCVSITTRG